MAHVKQREVEDETWGKQEVRLVRGGGGVTCEDQRFDSTTWSTGSSTQQVTHPENHSSLMLPHHLSIKMADISARRSNQE